MERVVQVKPNEFYKPVHDKTIENWSKINKRYEYTPTEQAEAKLWDFYRFSDDTYRFNVQVTNLTRVLDERDDTEYLKRAWHISGKSEIGNEQPFNKLDNIDVYKVPLYETKVVAGQGNQSLKTVTGEVTGIDIKYAIPFTVDNVIEAFKDSLPVDNLRYVTLNSTTHLGKLSVSTPKKYFLAWLLAPIEFLQEYNRTGNKAIVEIDINNIPSEYKDKINDTQIKKIDEIIRNSNIKLLEQLEQKQIDEEKRQMATKGIKDEQATTVTNVKEKVKKEEATIVSKRDSY